VPSADDSELLPGNGDCVSFSVASTSTTLFVSRLAISATLSVALDAVLVAGVLVAAVVAVWFPLEPCVSATAVAPTPPPASVAAHRPAITRFLVQVILILLVVSAARFPPPPKRHLSAT
jgi:hypothetical protein